MAKTIEEIVQEEMENNRALADLNRTIAQEIWGWNK